MDQLVEQGVDTKQIDIRTIGKVSPETVTCVNETVEGVFRRMNYKGEPPEVVSISQGAVVLPSGEEIEACYSIDINKKLKPGKILISTELSKKAFGESYIPTEIATAAFVAHEAVHHVNHMRGKEQLMSGSRIPTDIHALSKTEQEANQIAREVIENLYGLTVYFGDETPPLT